MSFVLKVVPFLYAVISSMQFFSVSTLVEVIHFWSVDFSIYSDSEWSKSEVTTATKYLSFVTLLP